MLASKSMPIQPVFLSVGWGPGQPPESPSCPCAFLLNLSLHQFVLPTSLFIPCHHHNTSHLCDAELQTCNFPWVRPWRVSWKGFLPMHVFHGTHSILTQLNAAFESAKTYKYQSGFLFFLFLSICMFASSLKPWINPMCYSYLWLLRILSLFIYLLEGPLRMCMLRWVFISGNVPTLTGDSESCGFSISSDKWRMPVKWLRSFQYSCIHVK